MLQKSLKELGQAAVSGVSVQPHGHTQSDQTATSVHAIDLSALIQ